MIVELGPTWWVKITDFGISKQCLDDLTALRTCAGTRYYIAPEVLEHTLRGERGERTCFSYTNAVDVWALGMTVYVLLLGELPFKDSSFERLRDYSCGKLQFPAEAMREKGLSTDAYHFTKSLMAPKPGDRPNVANCLTHQWLEQSSTPVDDIPDALIQALIDMDTQASRTWDSGPSMANAILNQQETARLHGGLPSRLPISSTSSQDSGIHMSFDMPHSTAHKIPPQSNGQEFSQQASGRGVKQDPDQPLASTYSQVGDYGTSCERPRPFGLEAPPVHNAPRARGWHMDKEIKYDSGEIKALALSPDGTVLVFGGDDKVIRVWDTKNWRQAGMLHGHTSTITDLAFCSSGKRLVSTSTDKTIRLWNVETLESVSLTPCSAKAWALAISPNEALLATGDGDGDVTISSMPSEATFARGGILSNEEEKPLLSLRSARCNKGVYGLAFSPDGQLLASAGKDTEFSAHYIKIWNPHTMTLVATLNHKSWSGSALSDVAFSRDGKVLASGGSDSIRLWDVATGTELFRCTKFDHRAFCAHFTFDGRIAFGTGENVVVWDTQAPDDPPIKFHVREMSWHMWNGVAKVVSWPDGTLATAADTVKIWRPVTTVEQE
jgi:WD40 repeat protein